MAPNDGNSTQTYSSSNSPNFAEEVIFDSSLVGEQEAENPLAYKTIGNKKQRKMVIVKIFSMPPTPYPEQGSWHLQRKKEILQKYPQVEKLYGRNPWTTVIMILAVIIQTSVAIKLTGCEWYTVLAASYVIGAYLNWIGIVTGHEAAHGLVVENRTLSRVLALTAFIPTFFGPFGYFWCIEHMYHHQIVVDKMNRFGPQSNGTIMKILGALLWVAGVNIYFLISSIIVAFILTKNTVLYIAGVRKEIYQKYSDSLRPFNQFPQVANTPWFFFNLFLQTAYFGSLFYFYGWTPIAYIFLGNSFCNGLHPLGMRNVSEHYIQRKGQPTNSVYSSWSWLLLNIGYHNEHHDFAKIPWNRLPQVRKIAKEYYDDLFYYNSFTEVLIDFLTNKGIPLSALFEEFEDTKHTK